MAELGESLSERELEVLNCLAKGSGNKEIAAALHISGNTVKVHLRNIYAKLGASSRTEATAVALQQGLITLPGMEAPVPEPEPADSTVNQVIEAEPKPESESDWLNRRSFMLLIGLLLLVGLLLAVANLAVRQSAITAVNNTPEPFEPEVVGENWKTLRPLPQARSGMASAAVGLNVYLIGGETAAGVDGTVLVYQTDNHTWHTAPEKPTAVTDASAAELFGEIYVPGGRQIDGSPTDIVEAYSPANDVWRAVAPLPEPIGGGLTLTDGSFLYLIGGWNGREYLNTAFVYDPGADEWQPLPPMIQPRANLMGGTVTGNLYAVGGTDGETILATCEYFNPAEQIWNECPDMLLARAGGGAVSIVNKLFVVGGQADDNPSAFGEFYNPESNIWNWTEPVDFLETPTLTALGVTNVETGIFVLGGRNGDQQMAESYIYAPLVYQTYLPAAPASNE